MKTSLINRRKFVQSTTLGAIALGLQGAGSHAAAPALDGVQREIEKRHEEAVKRLQSWIAVPSIAAENKAMTEGCDFTMQMFREAGFQQVKKMPTDGFPGIFATLDAGARQTVGLYFMYDVKQVDPKEWSSPPWEAKIRESKGMGRIMIGRGATNQKGPEAAFIAALHAIRAAGVKLPVNLVLLAEGEEEIGSPHFAQVVHAPEVLAALSKCSGVFMPMGMQDLGGNVTVNLGAKGVIELELVASGGKWGRGPSHDIHSSYKAMVDSPAWRLVRALSTLVSEDGNTPTIDGFADKVRPLTSDEKNLIREASLRRTEASTKKDLGVSHWIDDLEWEKALERLTAKPTVNIEGLVGGYTGPGGKTILPHRAVAKMDLRLVPDMTAKEALAALKAHLAKRGYGDIEVNMTGGYDPTTTPASSSLIQTQLSVYRAAGLQPNLWPRLAGSWPGYLFTGAPVNLPAGHFGLGHGSGAHAPDEYFLIESAVPSVRGFDGATRSFVDYLFALA